MLGARTAGNVGTALCELVGTAGPDEWIVCELSSFQLEDVHDFRPRVAVLLNLEPDHLDRHGSFERYREAKLRVFENQRAEDVAVVPRGFGPVPGDGAPRRVRLGRSSAGRAAHSRPAQPRERGGRHGGGARRRGRGRGDRARAPHLPGRPAPARARGGARRRPLRQRLEGDEHRGGPPGPERVRGAAPPHPRRLAQGGAVRRLRPGRGARERRRGVPDRRGGRAARGRTSRYANVPFLLATTLERAVAEAASAARPGEVVLLSPACASYDQFRDFEQRGEEFRRFVENLQA